MDLTKEELEVSLILKQMYDKLAEKFSVKEDFIVMFCPAPQDEDNIGIARLEEKIIGIDSLTIKTVNEAVCTLYHEFRHVYQYYAFNGKYRNILEYWANDLDFYKKYHEESLCIPERDADWFGKSFGGCNGLTLLDYEEDFYHLLKQDLTQLDKLNQSALQKIAEHLNLSSENKAIRFSDLESKLCKYLADKSPLESLLES